MNISTATILAVGAVFATAIWAATVLVAGSNQGAHQAIRVEADKPLIYVLDARSGAMRLCGPEACVPIRDRAPQAAQGQ